LLVLIELFPQFVHGVKIPPTRWAMEGMLAIVLRARAEGSYRLPASCSFAAVFFGIDLAFPV
jgi:hypothetical protein